MRDKLTEEQFNDFIFQVGWRVFHAPVQAQNAGHKNPSSTLCDYLQRYADPQTTGELATNFLCDFFKLRKEEKHNDYLIEKWFPNGAPAMGERLKDLLPPKRRKIKWECSE